MMAVADNFGAIAPSRQFWYNEICLGESPHHPAPVKTEPPVRWVTVEEVKSLAQYELMYILKPDLGEEQTQADIDRFNEAITAQNATITKVDKWGRRKLAYDIDKLTEGFYMLVTFEGSGDISNEITRVLKIHDDVVRSIVVRLDE